MTNDKARKMKEKYKVALVLLAVVFMIASIFAYYMDVDSIDKAAADVATPGAVAGLAEQAGETPTDGENVENIENTEDGAPPAENENGGSETSEPAIEDPQDGEGETSEPAIEDPQDGSEDGEGETSGPAVEEPPVQPPVQLPVVTERPVMRAAAAPITNTIDIGNNEYSNKNGIDWSYNKSTKIYTISSSQTGGTAVVTINGTMAVGGAQVSGRDVDAKKVMVNSNATITLDNINVSNWSDSSDEKDYGAFIEIADGKNVTIILKRANVITMKSLTSQYDNYTYAAMYVKESGRLTITSHQDGGTLNADGSIMQTKDGTINIKGAAIDIKGSKKSAGIGSRFADYEGGTINITDGSNVTVTSDYAGIGSSRGAGGTINISGDSTVVSATGGSNGAGIGGYDTGSGGTINITDGSTVVVTGGGLAAGIGGGSNGDSGRITINGGSKVTATGGTSGFHSGPGIGGGCSSSYWKPDSNTGGNKNTNSDITIGIIDDTTTEVVATAGDVGNLEGGAGIGGGYGCSGGKITINGGKVTALGKEGGAGIGGGHLSPDGGTITINGGTVLAVGQYDAKGNGQAVGGAGIGGAGGSDGGGGPAIKVTIAPGADVSAYSQDPKHPAIDAQIIEGGAWLVNASFDEPFGDTTRHIQVYEYSTNKPLNEYTMPSGALGGKGKQGYRCFAYTPKTGAPNFIMVWDKTTNGVVSFSGLAVDKKNVASNTNTYTYLIQPYEATRTESNKPYVLMAIMKTIIADKPTAKASRKYGNDGKAEEVVVLKSAVLRWPFTEKVNNDKANGTDYGFRSGIGSSIPTNDAGYRSPWEPDPDQDAGADNVIASPSSIVRAALEANSKYHMQTFATNIKLNTPWSDNPTFDYSFESEVVPFATLPKVTSAAAVQQSDKTQYKLSANFFKNPGGPGQADNVTISAVKIYYSDQVIDPQTYLDGVVKDVNNVAVSSAVLSRGTGTGNYTDDGFTDHLITGLNANTDYNFLVVIDNTADGLAGGGRDAYLISKGGAPTTLTVSARASGEFAERTRPFKYTVTFKDASGKAMTGSMPYQRFIDGEASSEGGLSLTQGVVSFNLKHGESISLGKKSQGASMLPDNAKITIVQTGESRYVTSYKDEDAFGTGVSKADSGTEGEGVTLNERGMSANREIEFMNKHEGLSPPTAVDMGADMVLILILAAILIGAICLAWWISRRRLQR